VTKENQFFESKTPYVVRLEEIHSSGDRPGLRERSFLSDPRLRGATAATGVHMRSVNLGPNCDSGIRTHEEPSLLIILSGGATLHGDNEGQIAEGDVVTIPAGREYRLVAGLQGLEGLQTGFAAAKPQASTAEDSLFSLETLLDENEARVKQLVAGPYFRLLQGDALAGERGRALFRDYTRVFSDAFQQFILLRQATCSDEDFGSVFGQHLREELGHNKMLTPSGYGRRFDPILYATSSWFAHQMLSLDNAGKAVIHLVLETGGYYFHSAASSVFAGDEGEEYFVTHSEDDDMHRRMVVTLLEGQHPETYKRLLQVLRDAWDMLDAMTGRTAALVEEARRTGPQESLVSDVRELAPSAAAARKRSA
jgi:quercetin dioxygenase-like cupin family protein